MQATSSAENGQPGGGLSIICNGEPRSIASGRSVADLVVDLGLNPDTTAVELNGQVLPRRDYSKTALVEGSRLELIRFVGGG